MLKLMSGLVGFSRGFLLQQTKKPAFELALNGLNNFKIVVEQV